MYWSGRTTELSSGCRRVFPTQRLGRLKVFFRMVPSLLVAQDLHYFATICHVRSPMSSKKQLQKKKGTVWYGLPNATDLWQPVDAGPGQLIKTLVGLAQTKWLEDDANSEVWYGHTQTLTAKL